MEKIGLVEKDHIERDARVRLVALTEAGARVFDEANTSFNQVAEFLLMPISPETQKALASLVRALLSSSFRHPLSSRKGYPSSTGESRRDEWGRTNDFNNNRLIFWGQVP